MYAVRRGYVDPQTRPGSSGLVFGVLRGDGSPGPTAEPLGLKSATNACMSGDMPTALCHLPPLRYSSRGVPLARSNRRKLVCELPEALDTALMLRDDASHLDGQHLNAGADGYVLKPDMDRMPELLRHIESKSNRQATTKKSTRLCTKLLRLLAKLSIDARINRSENRVRKSCMAPRY